MNYGNILECLKTIQECKNRNKKSCDKIKTKCYKELLLELVKNNKEIKNQYKEHYKDTNKDNITNNIKTILIRLQNLHIKELYKVSKLLNIFDIFSKIEQNKNNKEQLEQIKNEIEKNFDNEIKDHLIRLIDNYLTNLQQNKGQKYLIYK